MSTWPKRLARVGGLLRTVADTDDRGVRQIGGHRRTARGRMKPEVRVFGSIRVTTDGQTLGARDFGGRKPKQLLEILVLWNGRHVAKERLAHLMWGDELPVNAAGSLEHYVSVLRRRLGTAG